MATPKSPDWIAGFRACLDLIRNRIADCHTIEQVLDQLEGIELAVKEKQIEELAQELLLY
jgi:hypothetical protein